jgi:Putative peptidoglycan binding domain
VVFIGRSTAGRASTLVGDNLAEAWSHSGLSPIDVELAAGTQVAMELDEPLTVPAPAMGVAAASDVQHIFVSAGTVARAQQALSERKYYGGEADGQLDAATRNAIIRFQLDHEQLATGDLDEETLHLLGLPPPLRR